MRVQMEILLPCCARPGIKTWSSPARQAGASVPTWLPPIFPLQAALLLPGHDRLLYRHRGRRELGPVAGPFQVLDLIPAGLVAALLQILQVTRQAALEFRDFDRFLALERPRK